MVSRAVVTTLSGVGTFLSGNFLPDANARAVARLAGVGIGAVGAAMLFDEIRGAGGLGALAEDLVGAEGEVTSERTEVRVEPEKLKPGQIPYSGRFLAPTRGGTASKGLLRLTYPMSVELFNATGQTVTSSFVVQADEDRLFGGRSRAEFVSDRVTVRPGEQVVVGFEMPMGSGAGGTFGKAHPWLLPNVLATLTWPADPPFIPRKQDVVSFQVVT